MTEKRRYGPPCECHGLPMKWSPRPERSSGGYWCCAETARETERRYAAKKRAEQREARTQEARRIASLPAEIERLRADGRRVRVLLERARRRARAASHSRDVWRERALAAEWGLKQLERRTGAGHQMDVDECRRAA